MARFDATGWKRKLSTWLGVISGACAAAIVTFGAWPERLQALTPDWALLAMAAGAISSVFTPLATSFKQKSLEK